MPKVENSRSPQETVQAGLRILARIIVREVVKDRLANIDRLKGALAPMDRTPAEVGEYLKGAAQR
ncbi:MAG: hypothetical protein ACP5L3_07170 [Caldisericum sp.]|uniref:hypothetical protein n=1 Tax=Caldisericum sp. TaxID=2499687 RepID=UPI003D09FB29